MLSEGFEMIVGKAFGAVDTGDVFEAIDPKGQRIDDALGQDHFGRLEAIGVPDAAMRSGQIEMIQAAALLADLPSVNLRHRPQFVRDRKHNTAVKMLALGFAIKTDPLQSAPHFRAVFPVRLGQGQPQRAIGKADPEPLQRGLMPQAPFLEIVDCRLILVQSLRVVVEHLAKQSLVVCIKLHRRR